MATVTDLVSAGVVKAAFETRLAAQSHTVVGQLEPAVAPRTGIRDAWGTRYIGTENLAPEERNAAYTRVQDTVEVINHYTVDPKGANTSTSVALLALNTVINELTDSSWYRPLGLHVVYLGTEAEENGEVFTTRSTFAVLRRQSLGVV